ncbi:MAG: hypothetical protein JSS93_10110 [Bacteroidetes bacterium]|nr:hypothetical protein [Bacteroidota bacterium]
MPRYFALILSLLFFLNAPAQAIKKFGEFKTDKIENATVDRLGNLFLEFSNGQIKKYDPNGKVLARLKSKSLPTLLEPWFHPKIFAYYKEGQRIVNFNRNFEITDEDKLDPSVAIEPTLICPTNDNKFLVLDEADFSIKKLDLYNHRVLNEFSLDTLQLGKHTDLVFMREYLHLIFFSDKTGKLIMANELGKILKQFPDPVQNFGFFGEELFYLLGDRLVFFDLYTAKTRELKLSAGRFGIVTDERIFIVNEKKVTIYEYKPDKPDDPN